MTLFNILISPRSYFFATVLSLFSEIVHVPYVHPVWWSHPLTRLHCESTPHVCCTHPPCHCARPGARVTCLHLPLLRAPVVTWGHRITQDELPVLGSVPVMPSAVSLCHILFIAWSSVPGIRHGRLCSYPPRSAHHVPFHHVLQISSFLSFLLFGGCLSNINLCLHLCICVIQKKQTCIY